ncbi:MAG TPA: ATP-dependent Clp protease proteolytic subunit [Xanthobacteraceae bacterium]
MRWGVLAAAVLALTTRTAWADGVTSATSCSTAAAERSCAFDIRISGAISASTTAALKKALAARAEMMRREGSQNDWWIIHIDSGGGNVPAAIEIGRLLRSIDAPIQVDPDQVCASACVLVFAGATHRLAYGQIGIHRPYFQTPSTDFAVTDVQRWFDTLSRQIRSYLREVNVSERLADDLMAVPPEEMRYLSGEELAAYGLDIVDPVTKEAADLQEARKLGLDRGLYMQRKVLSESLCGVVDPIDAKTIRRSLSCANAVLAGKHVERAPPCRNRAATCQAPERLWNGRRLSPGDQVTDDGFVISSE